MTADPYEPQTLDAPERKQLARIERAPVDGCNRNTYPTMPLILKGLVFDGGIFISITPKGRDVLERVS